MALKANGMNDKLTSGRAALMFFTKIPMGKGSDLEPRHFDRIIEWWPLTGFITGGVAALCYFGCTFIFPALVSVLLALAVRVFMTGGLHEDGLSDFCDGFGANGDKSRVLAIMKDSSTGSYGVIGLIFYFGLFAAAISSLPVEAGALLIFSSDMWSKFCASKIVDVLPYARIREQSKGHIVYQRSSLLSQLVVGLLSFLPVVLLGFPVLLSFIAPVVFTMIPVAMMKRRIGGYTGDCCGAAFLIAQISMIITALALFKVWGEM